MLCKQCHISLNIIATYCPNCGSLLVSATDYDLEVHPTSRPPVPEKKKNEPLHVQTHDFSCETNESPQENNKVATCGKMKSQLKTIFSNVFVKHSEEDAENLFFVGTRRSTPNITHVMDHWPKPWLFARIFLVVGLLYFGLYLGVDYMQNMNLLPGLITMGSFMVPLTMLIFFWEMNAPQNISIYKIIKILFIGGILSLFIAVFIFDNIIGGVSVFVTGIVEEIAKLLVTLWFLRESRYHYIINGMLIGAAVGAGFAAFESAGYALQMVLDHDLERMYSTIFWRGVLAPGGHIVWAALEGAAICLVKGTNRFKWSMLKDTRFVVIFGFVVLLHSFWNIKLGTIHNIPVAQICFTIISWIVTSAVMKLALEQIFRLKKRANLKPIFAEQQNAVDTPNISL